MHAEGRDGDLPVARAGAILRARITDPSRTHHMAPNFQLHTLGGLHVEGVDGPLRGAAAQRRSLALLAVIAGARDRGASRDTLAAMFWPESDEEHARRALAQAIYRVRQELGAEVVHGGDRLRLDPERIAVDLYELEEAASRGDADRAIGLYRGPFLDGFNLPGAPDFSRWVDDERARIAARYADALTRGESAARSSGDSVGMIRCMRGQLALDPLEARTVVRLMHALAAAGDLAGALQVARIHETLLRQELDVAPDAIVVAAVSELREAASRAEASPRETGAAVAPPVPEAADASAPPPAVPPPTVPLRASDSLRFVVPRRAMRRAAAAAVVVLAGIFGAVVWARHREEVPVRLAVGEIVDLTGGDSLHSARALPELLTTAFGHFEPLEVVSRGRLYDLASQLGTAPDAAALARAARQAGAEFLVDGALYRRPGSTFRLDLRLLDLERGTVRASYQLEGSDAFALAEQATARLAGGLGARGTVPAGDSLETTRSLVALQLYEQGLRVLYTGDGPSAERLFAAALSEDSTFAMAAYYAYRSIFGLSDRAQGYLAQAIRHAPHSSERARLIILATAAEANFDPARVALAETLTARFPGEPISHVLLGRALTETRGDFAGARVAFREAFRMDSLGLRDGVARCSACEAQHGLVETLLMADSMEGAEHEARKWVERQPSSGSAWLTLAVVLGRRVDTARATQAFRRRSAAVPYAPEGMRFMVEVALRAGDFTRAERVLDNVLQTGGPAERGEALWWLTITQRNEGRLADALTSAGTLVRESPRDGARRLQYAQVLFEHGRLRESLAQFDTAGAHSRAEPSGSPSVEARRRTWWLTHLATVNAALGDTARLAALVEPMRLAGAGSGYGRDRVMHHYARGLLLAARGAAGAQNELRAAIFSPSQGYTRVNVELAKLQLARGQHEEAVALLRAALHGPLEASNLYVTHTELHALLARAFSGMGTADSAAVHRAFVSRALARADAIGRARFATLLAPSSVDQGRSAPGIERLAERKERDGKYQ